MDDNHPAPPPPPDPQGTTADRLLGGERQDIATPDARSLRGLAHPLRLQMLGLLRVDGPATATQLAARTGQSSGATSYHLRQLAAYGFVVEDETRTMNRRDRYWRAAHRLTMFDQVAADEASRAVGEEYLRVVGDANARRVQASIAGLATVEQDLGPGWLAGFTMSDLTLRLTLPEAKALIADLEGIAARYRLNDPDATATAPRDARRVVLQFQVLPEAAGSGATSGIDTAGVERDGNDV